MAECVLTGLVHRLEFAALALPHTSGLSTRSGPASTDTTPPEQPIRSVFQYKCDLHVDAVFADVSVLDDNTLFLYPGTLDIIEGLAGSLDTLAYFILEGLPRRGGYFCDFCD